jgi:hypothetical protein
MLLQRCVYNIAQYGGNVNKVYKPRVHIQKILGIHYFQINGVEL